MSNQALTSENAAERRPLLSALAAAASTLAEAEPERAWALTEDEVGQAVALAAEVVARAEALGVAAVGEAEERGLGRESSLSRTDWVLAVAPAVESRDAARAARVAEACRRPGLEPLRRGVVGGEVSVAKADLIGRFATENHALASREDLEATVGVLVEQAPLLTLADVRKAVRYAAAHLTPPERADRIDEGRRAARAFSRVCLHGTGMSEYRLLLDPEAAAVVDTAVSALSAPRPDPESGAPDPRSATTRRADALVELVTRGAGDPPTAPGAARAQLVVTMPYDALAERVRGAGIAGSGQVLSPGTVRRLACDADLIPAVLGTRRQVLDWGRSRRLVSRGQRLALWVRDAQCSFPGCSIPASWCEAHHVRHWSDGGATSMDNLAMLCGRHHAVVHSRGMTATIDPNAPPGAAVTWRAGPGVPGSGGDAGRPESAHPT